jgi:acyl-CoA synthetase (AMP-forming)/AMP-acid ligase II/thioesterase domain-containing protein/NAD(P)-dependent dehydrogenase (short-subunit alcohol dehydrogenase family)/acyl carrier protein
MVQIKPQALHSSIRLEEALSLEPSLELSLELSLEQLAAQIEGQLAMEPTVLDCAVYLREKVDATGSQPELLAYVVPDSGFSKERSQSHLPKLPVRLSFILIATLPLTEDGQVDRLALSQLAVLDDDLVKRWEDQLHQQEAIAQAAVEIEDYAEFRMPLHLADVIPGWQAGESIESAVVHAPECPAENHFGSPAISHGEPLEIAPETPLTLPEILQQAARSPHQGITYLQADGSAVFESYGTLLERAERILAGLRQKGLKPQDKVIFQLEQNSDFIAALWGCLMGGFVPVPVSIAPTYIEANGVVQKLHHAWQMLEQPLILAGRKLATAVQSAAGLLGLERWEVAIVEDLQTHDPDHHWHLSQPDDLAMLLLTSGSTGKPKGVMLSHRNIISRSVASAKLNQFSATEITLNWMPLDHVAGLIYFHLRDVYLACQQIHAPIDLVLQSPLRWLDWLERYQVTVTFAPNFAYGLVNEQLAKDTSQRDLSSVRFFLNGGEAIATRTARHFLQLLAPHGVQPTAMHPAWGMSETSSGVTYGDRFRLETTRDEDPFVEVGRPLPGFSLRIVDEHQQVVSEGVAGRLQVKGATVTSGYYQNPKANQESFTEDGWFSTGDLAYLKDGRLTITGREKDIIIIHGANYYSHEIETAVEELAGVEVSYTAACAVRSREGGDRLAIFFHSLNHQPDRLRTLLKEIRQQVVQKIGINPTYLIPVEQEAIPKTAIGKIQRSQLKASFEAGDFNSVLKTVDCISHNTNTLPDWFYQKVWQRKAAALLMPTPVSLHPLLFCDLPTLCETFPQPYTRIEAGSEFLKLAANHYQIDPNNATHYHQLFADWVSPSIRQIVYLWGYGDCDRPISPPNLHPDEHPGEHPGEHPDLQSDLQTCSRLISLIQALADHPHPTRLLVVAHHSQQVTETDTVNPNQALLLGILKAASQEMPWLDCRHLDIPHEMGWEKKILQEMQVIPEEREVAYRQGQRWIPRLRKADFQSESLQDLPFKSGGLYLISGGLGGIGVTIAQYLLQNYSIKLLLIGRTPLPPSDTWDQLLQEQDSTTERLRAYRSLIESTDSDRVCYEAVDISDDDRLQQIVKRLETDWQCFLEGILHCAGIYQEQTLVDTTAESFAQILQPKVSGAWALHRLLKGRSGRLFVHFSSLTSFFGGAMIGGYAAANAFLDHFVHYQRQQGIQSHCLSWSLWNETGISRGTLAKEALRARGYETMTAEQGVYSLLAGLRLTTPHLLVGLNAQNRLVRRYLNQPSYALQQLAAYYSPAHQTGLVHRTADPIAPQLEALEMGDRFQTPTTCQFQQVTATAENRQQLLTLGKQSVSPSIEPRTPLEKQIAAIWQEILNVPNPGIYDNFFELGGSSLLGVRLLSQLEQAFGLALPPTCLFTAPTIAGLVVQITSAQPQTAMPHSPVFLLKAGGDRLPFFWIPGGGAVDVDFLMYAPLLQALSPDQPVYGLEARRVNERGDRYKTVEAMAADYVQDIQAIQPQGPYLLGGECVGGILGVEIARCLQDQGEQVALLVLLDSGVPQQGTYLRYRIRKAFKNLSRRAEHHRQRFFQFGFWKKSLYYWNQITHKVRKDTLIQEPSPKIDSLEAEQAKILRTRLRYDPQEKEHRAALLFRHQVRPYPGRVTLLINEARYHERYDQKAGPEWTNHRYPQDPSLGWQHIAAEGVEIHVIPGNHDTYIREEVQSAAQVLDACLGQAIA